MAALSPDWMKKFRKCIGNNINQIACSVNAGTARAEDAKQGPYLPAQVYDLIYQAAKKRGGLRMFR